MIVDEKSMLKCKFFYFVNFRLRQIFCKFDVYFDDFNIFFVTISINWFSSTITHCTTIIIFRLIVWFILFFNALSFWKKSYVKKNKTNVFVFFVVFWIKFEMILLTKSILIFLSTKIVLIFRKKNEFFFAMSSNCIFFENKSSIII